MAGYLSWWSDTVLRGSGWSSLSPTSMISDRAEICCMVLSMPRLVTCLSMMVDSVAEAFSKNW